MKTFKIIATIILSCITLNIFAQPNQSAQGEIVIGKIDSIYSDVLQEHREFWVYTPKNIDSTKLYPVIYVLDAPTHYYAVTGMLTRLTQWLMPKSIVIGITNTDRIRDFTPTNVKIARKENTETSGGASNFSKFLEQELLCLIEDTYPTENNKTIVGHSTAGLFVLYSYLNNKDSFDNYIVIDPNLSWDKENLVKQSQKLINNGNYKNKSLYVAVANSLGEKMDTVKVRRNRSEITEHIRSNLNFHDVLVKNKKKLNFKWEYFKNEDHGSITVPAQYNGFKFVFSWFPFPKLWRFNTPEDYSIKQLTEPFYDHYKKLSTLMKRNVKPDWELVNDIGSFMLEVHNFPKKALAYFEMNAYFYPDYSKTYVVLGDYYISQKEISAAIKNYKKAIEIDGNKEALIKLKKLNKSK